MQGEKESYISSVKKHFRSFIFLTILCSFSSFQSLAETKSTINSVKEITFKNDHKINIRLAKKAQFKIFTLKSPQRLVVDLDNVIYKAEKKPKLPKYIDNFRHTDKDGKLRLVFELEQEFFIKKARFEKIKTDKYGSIVVQLTTNKKVATISNSVSGGKTKAKAKNSATAKTTEKVVTAVAAPANFADFIEEKVTEFDSSSDKTITPNTSSQKKESSSKQQNEKSTKKKSNYKPIIIIDAGHGGKDPGTVSKRSSEKNITLAYAKELRSHLLKTKKYRVYLTRDRDIFIPLRQRVQIARRKKADLFISLHVNSSPRKSAEGFSIYTLSEKSSDKQAEKLAQKENRADIINGMDFSATSKDIVNALIDMSQRDTKNRSSIFANKVINTVKKYNINTIQNTHRFAGFAVLTAPDMASVLIELGYSSNRNEEKLLNSKWYRRKVAKSITKAIDSYF